MSLLSPVSRQPSSRQPPSRRSLPLDASDGPSPRQFRVHWRAPSVRRRRLGLLLLAGLIAASMTLARPARAADALALRHGQDATHVSAVLGVPTLSVAAPIPGLSGWQGAVSLRLPADSLSLYVGRRAGWVGGDHGWYVDGLWSVGVVAPLVSAGVGLGVTGAAQAGWRCDGFVSALTLAAPVVVGWSALAAGTGGGPGSGVGVRVPVLLELTLRWRVYRAWLGVQVGAGPVWTPGLDTAMAADVALVLALPL